MARKPSFPSDSSRPRYSRPVTRGWGWVLLVILVVATRWWWGEGSTPPKPPAGNEGTYVVERVVDGDTLKLKDGTRVRLQGIDTPETVDEQSPVEPWGPEASAYTKAFIEEAGNRVDLTFDKERLDQYGRLLAYVWHGDRLLNEELVREGLAETRPNYPQSETMRRRLRKALDDAKQARRGLWSGAEPANSRSLPRPQGIAR